MRTKNYKKWLNKIFNCYEIIEDDMVYIEEYNDDELIIEEPKYINSKTAKCLNFIMLVEMYKN